MTGLSKTAKKTKNDDLLKSERLPEAKIVDNGRKAAVGKSIEIPKFQEGYMRLTIVGTAPLLVNNKMDIAYLIAEKYDGGPGKSISRELKDRTPEEQYKAAFYVLHTSKESAPHPDADYGVPLSGISKCLKAAVRCTGISDNTQVGNVQKAIQLVGGVGPLCLLRHNGFEMDTRPVNIGSGQKTVPSLRYRPIFHEWEIDLEIRFNPINISPEKIVDLAGYAGAYIGLCELRAQKGQGQCGGFRVAKMSQFS